MRVIRLTKHYKRKTMYKRLILVKLEFISSGMLLIIKNVLYNFIKGEANLTDHLCYAPLDTRRFLTEFKFKEQQKIIPCFKKPKVSGCQ